jgi:hypothetical protein
MAHKYANKTIKRLYKKRNFYKVNLDDLQKYFNYHVFYFDEDYNHEDYDEAITRKYEEQSLIFLRRIGAMLSVDAFLSIGNNMVYMRQLPSGLSSLQGER